MTTHHAPDTGFKLFALVKDVLAESSETDTDQLALEVLERIPAYDRETALFQALRQLVRTSFRPAFIPAIPKQATTGEASRTSDNPPPERDGRQWMVRDAADDVAGEPLPEVANDGVVEGHAPLTDEEADAALAKVETDIGLGIKAGHDEAAVRDMAARARSVIGRQRAMGHAAQQQPPSASPRPKTSPKVAAIREAWRKSLMQRIAVGDGKHKFLGDCTANDLQFAAKQREEHALRTQNRAAELRRLVDLMREHGATHLSDLPAEVLAEAPLESAA